MDELRESSLLFSLESLLETERERVQREAREAQKRHDEELKRVAEAAARRRASAERASEARGRRLALEQERERMDEERMDAMKRAAVERARIETEGQLRLIEVEQARQHDLALAKLREGQRTTRYRTLSWLGSGAFLTVCIVAAAGYFAWLRPAHARETEQLHALLGGAQSRVDWQERVLTAERNKALLLDQRIAELESQLSQSKPSGAALPSVSAHGAPREGSPSGAVPPRVDAPPCVDNGDPLNPCLSRRRR
jgi:hypothetical protein